MDEFDVLMGDMRRIQHTDQGHPSMVNKLNHHRQPWQQQIGLRLFDNKSSNKWFMATMEA
jgi:hypothetical protein